MRIQHNIAALNSYRNLTNNNSAVSKNLEKLSSGYKINRAGDDAAGLAISEKMRAQITGLETAQKNANDGISLVQTAEGALTEVHSMLNRMVELSNQSANGTYDDKDREQLQKEIVSLKDEIDRISEGTNFNGINLLDGSLAGGASSSTGTVTIGKNISEFSAAKATGGVAGDLTSSGAIEAGTDTFDVDGQTLKIDWTQGDAAKIFDSMKVNHGTVSADTLKGLAENLTKLFNDQMKEQGLTGGVKVTVATGGTYSIESTNEGSTSSIGWTGAVGVTAANVPKSLGSTLFSTTKGVGEVKEAGKMFANSVGANDTFNMTINGTTVQVDLTNTGAIDRGIDLSGKTANLTSDIQAAIAKYNTALNYQQGDANFLLAADFTVSLDKSGGLKVVYSGEKDVNFSFSESTTGTTGKPGKTASLLGLAGSSSSVGGSGGLTLQIGDTAAAFNQLAVSVGNMSASSLGIGAIDISNQAGAKAAVDVIKSAINSVSATRGDLGAIQNRLEHTINNLSVTTENMTAAESRIRDVDMANEMMAYTKNNILVQSSQAMLAQANQIPQGVLQLLQ